MGKSLAIVGAGTMGRGITQVFLQVGFKVVLLDIENRGEEKVNFAFSIAPKVKDL